MFLFLVCICADVSLDRVPHDKVDVIERNHLYDGKGELNFTQYIFWDLDFRGDYHVIAWRMEKVDGSTIRPPHKDWRSGFYQMNFFDRDKLRRISSCSYRETWTQVDPEVEDRKIRPVEYRRGLSK